jgi:hypothetical protein
MSDLLTLMIVFYMAALAAVATFDREGIDNELEGDPATLRVREGGRRVNKNLTYRQFVSYLFGYLAFLSLVLYIFVMAGATGWKKLEAHFQAQPDIHHALATYVDPLLSFMVFVLFWQLIVTSLLGIYFLTERIQTLYTKPPEDGC